MQILILFCLFFLPSIASATALSDAAAALSVGSWTTLTTTNIDTVFLGTGGSTNYQIPFNESLRWDPVDNMLYTQGADHNALPGKLAKYHDATNTWSSQTPPSWGNHGYDHVCLNPLTRILYFREYGNGNIHRYDLASQTYISDSTAITGTPFQVAGALECLPSRNSMFFVDGDWGTREFSFSTGSWVQRSFGNGNLGDGNPDTPMGPYHNFAEYNPVHRVVIFGGGDGSQKMYKYSESGVVTALSDAPVVIGIQKSIITVDPISGLYLVFSTTSNSFYTYNVLTDTWTDTGTTAPIFQSPVNSPSTDGVIAGYIPEYGVNVFVDCSSSACVLRLYKHSSATSADLDFLKRCGDTGVIRCFSFDTSLDVNQGVGGTQGAWGGNYGVLPVGGTSTYRGLLDTSEKASGAGSLKFTIPSNSGSDSSGSFFANFSFDNSIQFGSGQTFYIQWRQWFSPCFLYQGADDSACLAGGVPRTYTSGGGWKQSILGSGDPASGTCVPGNTSTCIGSCTDQELVSQNTNHKGVPQMYHSCTGGDGAPAFAPFEEQFDGTNFRLQNAYSGVCPFSETNVNNITNCFKFYPNEWMTFKVRVTLGTHDGNSYPNSTVEQWACREGEACVKLQSYVAGVNAKNLINTSSSESRKYGKVWLLPYNTNKSSGETHPTAYTAYDELIFSTQNIAAPGFASDPPASPGGLTLSGVNCQGCKLQ